MILDVTTNGLNLCVHYTEILYGEIIKKTRNKKKNRFKTAQNSCPVYLMAEHIII